MTLTWRDAIATLFMCAIGIVYVAFLNGVDAWLILSARGTTAVVLLLGMFGGCTLGMAKDLFTGSPSAGLRIYRTIASTLGAIALAAALAGLITGSTLALATLVAMTFVLWFISTARHAGGTGQRAPHRATHSQSAARR